MRDVTFATTFTAESNSTGEVEVFTNTEGLEVQLDRVTMYKAGDSIGNVLVGAFAGEKRLAPDNAPLAVGPNPLNMDVDEPIGPDATVEVRWENTSGTARGVTVVVHGEKNEE